MTRRERKKAATRQALADSALRLFLERGYDGVTVREVAEAADVSATTLLNHFPSKEALLFDEEADIEAGLAAAVRDRASGVSIPQALCAFVVERQAGLDDPRFGAFLALIRTTPALAEYAHRMWMRHQDALAAAIAADVGMPADDPHAQALARFTLESTALAHRSADPQRALEAAFDLLERGWSLSRSCTGRT
jgi:AcrR family transcriptional regulator